MRRSVFLQIGMHFPYTKRITPVSIGCHQQTFGRQREEVMNARLSAAIIAVSVLVFSHGPLTRGASVPEELEPRLEEFFTEKQVQARSLTKLEKQEGTPE